ncbi:hypothetical protein [Nocardioides sp. SYSU D00038]|uniref:Vgb family protein n=1 Tax=Nocardioides sp. SYSU D00038 TaxID=2812554 RepID=UPI0019687D0F|nr:hypothetical protein [Nocardioides sp. SYSU D00038]
MVTTARRTLAAAVTLGLAALVVPTTSAGAAPARPVQPAAKPTLGGPFEVDGEPGKISVGPDGNVWFGVTGNSGGNDLGRITPSGTITYYDLGSTSVGWLTPGPDKNLWATTATGVARIPTGDPTTVATFTITGFNQPEGIVTGPDKNLWAVGGDTLYRVPPAAPTTATPFTVAGMQGKQVTANATHVWVADAANGKVHAFKTDGTHTSVDVGGNPQGVVAGANGQVLYSNPENANNHVARLTLGRAPQKTALPGTDPSFGVAYGADRAYWVGLFLTRKIARITADGTKTEYGTFPDPYKPRYVTAGAGGTIWASLQDPGSDGAIGRVTGLDVDNRATVTLKSTRVKVKRGKAQLRLKCPASERSGPCSGKVTLKKIGKPRKHGSKKWSARAGRTVTVKVGLKGLRVPHGGVRVLAVIEVKDKAGNRRTIRKKIRLVR